MLQIFRLFEHEQLFIKMLFFQLLWLNGTPFLMNCPLSNPIWDEAALVVRLISIKAIENGRSIMFDFVLQCSSLNQHLFKRNIFPSPLCQCGKVESNYHFFFECQRYVDSRACFLNTLFTICSATLQTLLNGDPNISDDSNRRLFEAIHTYIRESRRFSWAYAHQVKSLYASYSNR
jgi:hypothetical protein